MRREKKKKKTEMPKKKTVLLMGGGGFHGWIFLQMIIKVFRQLVIMFLEILKSAEIVKTI